MDKAVQVLSDILLLPHLLCNDGAVVSVQVGWHTYCEPRNNVGPYTLVEAGFPSVIPPQSWLSYAEQCHDYRATIYPYLPLELVYEFVDTHGGCEKIPDLLARGGKNVE